MKKKRRWLSTGFALMMLFSMLLAPGGWGVPTAQAGDWDHSKISVGQVHPDPVSQTVTVTYNFTVDRQRNADGEWYIKVARGRYEPYKVSDAELTAPPYNGLKKSMNSEINGDTISGSWTIPISALAPAVNQPVPLGYYEFRFYTPYKHGFLFPQEQDMPFSTAFIGFSVVNNDDVVLDCPSEAAPGDMITVSWQDASLNGGAWIGFFKKDAPDTSPIKRVSINASYIKNNQWTMDSSFSGITTGDYEFRIFQDSGYTRNGAKSVWIRYNNPTLTVKPDQGRPGDTLVVSWTNGPNYDPYAFHRVDIFQGNKLYTNLQTGLWSEQTINFKIPKNMPAGMYQMRMINNDNGSVMAEAYLGVQAADTGGTAGGGSGGGGTNGTAGTTTITPVTGITGSTTITTTTGTIAGNASPLQLTAVASGQSVVLNWTPPADTTGLTGYYIYRGASEGGESASPLQDFPVTGTTFTDTTVRSGTYYYIVKPVYNNSTQGAASNEASATVGAAGGVTIVLQVGEPTMMVNGVSREIDPGQGTAPVMVEGRVFVPIRSIVEAMGGTIGWTASEQKLTINLASTAIDLWVGQNTALVNGETKTLDVAPYISDTDRTMLPLRFVIENLGCQVQWDGATQKVTIIYGGGGSATTTPPPSADGAGNGSAGTSAAGNGQGSLPFDDGSASTGAFTGLWTVKQGSETNHHIYLIQNGSQVKGVWDDRMVITGTVTGNVFTGTWYTQVNSNPNDKITITLAANGGGFDGSYRYSNADRPFSGVKDTAKTAQITAAPTSGAAAANFTGTWGTTAGNIILTQSGSQVSGTWGNKTMSGTVNGNVLNGRYYLTAFPALYWDFNMIMNADGKGFSCFDTVSGGRTYNGWRK